jgi:hypothetical protein
MDALTEMSTSAKSNTERQTAKRIASKAKQAASGELLGNCGRHSYNYGEGGQGVTIACLYRGTSKLHPPLGT